jgi:hypothetical protein
LEGRIDASALYFLARPSTPTQVVEAVRERAAAGERVTHASVKTHVESFKRKTAEASTLAAAVASEPPAGDPDEPPLPFGRTEQPLEPAPAPAPVAAKPAPEDLDEPSLPLPEPASERAERSPEPAPAPGPAENPAPDLVSEFAALHRRLTALGDGAKEVARAVPPGARRRHLDPAGRVLVWLEDYCWMLDELLKAE